MKKNISFKWEGGSSLTREQLKHVVGGSGSGCLYEGQYCTWHGKSGRCQYLPFSGGLVCWCG